MRIFNTFCFLIATLTLASATPVNHLAANPDKGGLDLVESGSSEGTELLPRADISYYCRKAGQVIDTIGSSKAVLAFIHLTSNYAKSICDGEGAPNCARYIKYIEDGIDLIFIAAAMRSGGVGVNLGTTDTTSLPTKRDALSSEAFGNSLHNALLDAGWKHDSMENVDVSKLSLGKRDNEPGLTHRFIARNVTYNDRGDTSDVGFNYFENGDLNLHFAGDFGSLPSDPTRNATMQRRGNRGAGFKIATTTRTQSKLSKAHQHDMAHVIAQNWGSYGKSYYMSEYIGLVKTSKHANFYFRIMPEISGFGLNYESVNVCGELKGFLSL